TAFRVGPGAEVDGHAVVGVALIDHGAAPGVIDVLAFGLIGCSTAAQCGRSRSRPRRDAAKQRGRRPAATAPATIGAAFPRDILARESEDVVEQRTVGFAEGVGRLLVLALRQRGVRLEVMANVGTPALNQVASQSATHAFTLTAAQIVGEVREVAV